VSFFWVTFTLSWFSVASFVGLTGFLLCRYRGPYLLPYLGASILIVLTILIELFDQNAIWWVRGITYWLSMGAMILLIASWLTPRSLPDRLAKVCRWVSAVTFFVTVIWSLGTGIFLPLLFFPARDVLGAHVLFSLLFLIVSVAVFVALSRTNVGQAVEAFQKIGSLPERRKRPWRLALNLALTLLLLFWLAQWMVPGQHGGLVSSVEDAGMSPAMLDDTEILCSGHFSQSWQPFRWCWNVQLQVGPPGLQRSVRARRKIVPFIVDHYWKGNGPREIDIALFQPTQGFWAGGWRLPAQENLLVALKRDTTGSTAYQFVDQHNSWLVIPTEGNETVKDASPEKVIEAYTSGYLQRYATGPEQKRQVMLLEPLTIDSIAGLFKLLEINNVSVVRQALATARNFRMEDEATIALLKQMLAEPEQDISSVKPAKLGETAWTSGSPVRQEALKTLIKLAPDSADLMAWLKSYNAQPNPAPSTPGTSATIDNQDSNLSWEVATAIRDSDHLDKITPLIEGALRSPNPRVREAVAHELYLREGDTNNQYEHGRDLGPNFYPIAVGLLDDPDRKVEYSAMGCLFYMSGSAKKPVRERELHLWAVSIVDQNPALYVAQYKEWWDEQKSRIAMTQAWLDQIRKGLINYETAYGNLPAENDPRALLLLLQVSGRNKTSLLPSGPYWPSPTDEPVDAWGTRLRISLADPKTPLVQSAGLDKKWDTPDDLTGVATP
jgi:hypothetical protein